MSQNSGIEATRPQPQTTGEAPGGPFIRHTQPGRGPIYARTADALGALITQALIAKPGYLRRLRLTEALISGGALTSAVVQPDAPFNLVSLLQLKDAFGTPLLTGSGFEMLNLVNMFGGGWGIDNKTNDVSQLPSYSALSATTGAGSFSTALPLEFAKAIGVIGGANASLPPQLQMTLNTFAAILGAGTGTAPTVNTTLDADYYWLPEIDIEPPGLGTTRQWSTSQMNPTLGSGASSRLNASKLGGYLDTLIFIVRDSLNARTDGYWPSRLVWSLDGVPIVDSTMNEIYDDMAIEFGAVTRPTGVIAFTRKTALSQKSNGLLDTGETYLSTNPGTSMELAFQPAGAGANSPATVNTVFGQIVPSGSLIQGLPEV